MKNTPKKIYLQIGEDTENYDFNHLFQLSITWSDCRINENDLEYVHLRELIDKFYEWLDGLTSIEYDSMSITDKCENFFFNNK